MNQKLALATRLVLGLLLFTFGLNGFLNFMPTPPPSAEAGALFMAFGKTGYFFPFVKFMELAVGLLLLSNKFTAFALVLIAPILVGIAQINFILNPGGIPVTVVLLLLFAAQVYDHKNNYKSLFQAKQ